jgi:hypothetical protein
MENVHPAALLRDEIPRKEAYVKGIRHKAKGTGLKKQFIISFEPCALGPAPHLYAAVTRDEGNAANGRFPTASSETWTFLVISCKTTEYFVIKHKPCWKRD